MSLRTGYKPYRKLLDCFVAFARQAFEHNLISVVLYGSVARGEAKQGSDIDILLIVKKAPSVYRKRLNPVLDIISRIRSQPCWKELETRGIFPDINVMMLTNDEAAKNRGVYLDMIEDSVILLDRSDFFKRRLKAMKRRVKELGAIKIRVGSSWYWDIKPDLKFGETVVL